SRDAANLVAAHRELAPPRYRGPRAGRVDARAHGAGRRSAERRRSRVPEHGAGLRAQHRVPGRARPRVQGARGAERLYGAHAHASPRGVQGASQRWLTCCGFVVLSTRQTVFPTSSATSRAPVRSIATPTGRPRASPASLTKPVKTSSAAPEGLPRAN